MEITLPVILAVLQTDYVIGSLFKHQDPFFQGNGSQLTENEPSPFRQAFASRKEVRLANSFPGSAQG